MDNEVVTFKVKKRTVKTVKIALIAIAVIALSFLAYSVASYLMRYDIYAYVLPEIGEPQSKVDDLIVTLESHGVDAKASTKGQITVSAEDVVGVLVRETQLEKAVKLGINLDKSVWHGGMSGKVAPPIDGQQTMSPSVSGKFYPVTTETPRSDEKITVSIDALSSNISSVQFKVESRTFASYDEPVYSSALHNGDTFTFTKKAGEKYEIHVKVAGDKITSSKNGTITVTVSNDK